jgi:hypothetical protein
MSALRMLDERPSIIKRDKTAHLSGRLHKNYDCKGSVKKKNLCVAILKGLGGKTN